MRKLFIIGIGLFVLLQCVTAGTISREDKHLRDSIFREFHAPALSDTLRVMLMHSMFQKHVGEDWVVELLDSAMISAVRSQYVDGELALYYDYFRQNMFKADPVAMRRNFQNLRVASAKHESYNIYFFAWGGLLDFYNMQGYTESAILEARQMEEEARRLGNIRGTIIASMAEGKALTKMGRYDEALKILSNALEIKEVILTDRMYLFSYIAAIYSEKKEYDKAISNLQEELVVLQQLEKQYQGKINQKDNFIGLELKFAKVYIKMDDAKNTYIHLKEAGKYYTNNTLFASKAAYLLYWGLYYQMTKDWNKCISYCNQVIDIEGEPNSKIEANYVKAQVLMATERYEEASKVYRQAVEATDAQNRDILKRHIEVHQANYSIRQALLNKETAEMYYNLLKTGGIILFVLIIFGLLLHAFYVHHMLKLSKRKTLEALNEAKAADKMKEVFLSNITNEIRIPLNVVVELSGVLTANHELTQEKKEEYAGLIKCNAEWLTKLVFDILDLSRLESGMMKFEVQTCDAVQLCRDAKMMVDMQEGNPVPVEFETELDTLPIEVDSGRFMKLLRSVLSAVKENKAMSVVKYHLEVEGGYLKITILNSPLLEQQDVEGNTSLPNRIQHDINRIYLGIFKGNYQIVETDDMRSIIIRYPC